MDYLQLYLYTRKGCCLCQGLEERIRELPLESLEHPLKLNILDIDSKDIDPKIRNRYDFSVPVLALMIRETGKLVELPRVSPRLKQQSLSDWLLKKITKIIE